MDANEIHQQAEDYYSGDTVFRTLSGFALVILVVAPFVALHPRCDKGFRSGVEWIYMVIGGWMGYEFAKGVDLGPVGGGVTHNPGIICGWFVFWAIVFTLTKVIRVFVLPRCTGPARAATPGSRAA